MKLYVQLEFSPDGADPFTIVTEMHKLGFFTVLGDYDFSFEFEKPEEYRKVVLLMHELLKGTGVRYSLSTKKQ